MVCIRCKEPFGSGYRCQECGVAKDRVVRYKRNRNIGGKRGRNSGKTSNAKSGGTRGTQKKRIPQPTPKKK